MSGSAFVHSRTQAKNVRAKRTRGQMGLSLTIGRELCVLEMIGSGSIQQSLSSFTQMQVDGLRSSGLPMMASIRAPMRLPICGGIGYHAVFPIWSGPGGKRWRKD
jgi:hypothetical protein